MASAASDIRKKLSPVEQITRQLCDYLYGRRNQEAQKHSIDYYLNNGADLSICVPCKHFQSGSGSALMAAVAFGHHAVAGTFLKKGATANLADKNGQTAVFHATSRKAVDMLIEAGADLTHKDNEGLTAFNYLCKNDSADNRPRASFLLDIDPSLADTRDNARLSPLCHAIDRMPPFGNDALFALIFKKSSPLAIYRHLDEAEQRLLGYDFYVQSQKTKWLPFFQQARIDYAAEVKKISQIPGAAGTVVRRKLHPQRSRM